MNYLANRAGLSDFIDSSLKTVRSLLGDYWYSNISKLTYRINWNKNPSNPLRLVPFARLFLMPVSEDTVERIVAVYMNLVLSQNMIEYDRKKNPTSIPKIESAVAQYYGQNPEMVKLVLYELYWATMDGTIDTDEFLRPRTYKEYCSIKEKPDTKGDMGQKGFLDQLIGTLETVGWVILGTVLIFGGWFLYNNLDSIGSGIKKLTGSK